MAIVRWLIVLVCLGAVCGCKPAKSPAVDATPSKAAVDLAGEMRKELAPMLSAVVSLKNEAGWGDNGTGAQAWLSDQDRDKCLAYLREAKAKHEGNPDGQTALLTIRGELSSLVFQACDQGRWRLAAAAIDGYEILSPGDIKFDNMKARVQLHINRPEVVLLGFFEDIEKKQVYVQLRVTLHPSNETKTVHVRKGEEFDDLRVADIIGNLRGVKLEYLKIPGEFFTVMQPR